MESLRLLPLRYEFRRVEAEEIGAGFAWKKEDIIDFLRDKRTRNLAVLGGEVFLYKKGKICPTNDNWYGPHRQRGEDFESFCQRSRKKALDYIQDYPIEKGVIFVPALASELEF